VTFSQSIGIIGYSLLPLTVTVGLIPFSPWIYLSWLLKIVGTLWASFSAGSLLITPEIMHKKFLLGYPILLLYIYFISLQGGV